MLPPRLALRRRSVQLAAGASAALCVLRCRPVQLVAGAQSPRWHAAHAGGAALFVQAQWQGEGGANAHGIVQGCRLAASALASALPQNVPRIDGSVAAPRGKGRQHCERGLTSVRWHSDLAAQVSQAFAVLDEASPGQLFTAGGDCSVDLAPCSWLLDRYDGDVAVLYVDAHADLNIAEESPSGHFHGMSLRALLGDAPPSLSPRRALDPAALILAGLRELDPPEEAFLKEQGIGTFSPASMREVGGVQAVRRALKGTGRSRLHVHLDLDVLDPVAFPHVSVPSAGGLSFGELRNLLRQAADELPLVGLTVTELRPRLSTADVDKEECRTGKAQANAECDEFCLGVLRDVLGPDGLDVRSRVSAGVAP